MSKTEVANIKAKNAIIAFSLHFLSSSSLSLFSLPFNFLRWCDFLALLGAIKLSFGPFFTASFVRFVFKKSVRYTIFTRFYTQTEASTGLV